MTAARRLGGGGLPGVADLLAGGAGIYLGFKNGATDNLAAWNSFVSNHDYIVIPDGDYLFSEPMDIPQRKTVLGMLNHKDGTTGTIIRGTSGQAAALRMSHAAVGDSYSRVENLSIQGAANAAVYLSDVVAGVLRNIAVAGTFTKGFHFAPNVFDNTLDNLFVGNSTITEECFYAQAGFNSNDCSRWYTTQAAAHNIRIAGGQASEFSALTVQGGTVGLAVEGPAVNHTFDSLYAESIATSLVLGVSGNTAVGHTFNGCQLGGNSAGVACIDIVDAESCVFNAPRLIMTSAYTQVTADASAGGGTGAVLRVRVNSAGQINSVHVIDGGTGYAAGPFAVTLTGSGGSGATATAVATAGVITAVTVTGVGSGYPNGGQPIAGIRYRLAKNIVFIAPKTNEAGTRAAPYSTVMRHPSASSGARVNILMAPSGRESNDTAASMMRGARGLGFQHYVEELDSAGARVFWSYVPPST